MKHLVIFGDSWCYGDELGESYRQPEGDSYRLKHCFAGLMAQHYGLELVNYAYPGNSVPGTVRDFFFWLNYSNEWRESLVLVGYTHPSRTTWPLADDFPKPTWNQKTRLGDEPSWVDRLPSRMGFHSTYLEGNKVPPPMDRIQRLNQEWRVHCHNEQIDWIDYQQAVYSVWGACQLQNIKLLQFNLYDEPALQLLPDTLIRAPSLDNLLKRSGQDSELRAPEMHPNEQGHKLVSDFLIFQISSRKMLG